MWGHGKCPKCDQSVNRCDLDQVIVGNQAVGPFFYGVSICCPNPNCRAVLGVIADPASMAADVADHVARKIQGTTR